MNKQLIIQIHIYIYLYIYIYKKIIYTHVVFICYTAFEIIIFIFMIRVYKYIYT